MSLPCFAIHSLSFFVFSALQQNNEETTGQEFDFPQAGGIHDRSDDRYVMVNCASVPPYVSYVSFK